MLTDRLIAVVMFQFTVHVANVAESWHPRSVAEGHFMNNCDGERYYTVLQHCPAFVQQLTERNLMRSCENARDLVTVN